MQLAFWNASVAPNRGRGTQSVRQAASRVRQLMSSGASLVALCEMDNASAANAEGRLRTSEVEVISACEAIGRSRWDIVDTPMSALRAVRDPRLVSKHPRQLLFNASWSLAGPPLREPWGRFGSYRYPGRTSMAYQLDQALVSAHFLDEARGWAPLARNRSDVEPEGASGHLPLELVLA